MQETNTSLKIALLGTRGIPARYGGFETFAQELSTRLVERGHQVTVYARKPFFKKKEPLKYKGVTVRYASTIFHKFLETPLAAITSFIDLFKRDIDLVLLCNAANSPFAWLATLRGLPVAVNVDGIERRRTKWNWLGRSWYLLGEHCSKLFCTRVIADAEAIACYYRGTHKIEPTVIAYGAQAQTVLAGETLCELGVESKKYILYVSRLEPENNALGVIQAYVKLTHEVQVDIPLVIVGDAPYADGYKAELKAAASKAKRAEMIIFAGYQFGNAYHELQSNALIYIQATEVGGTHPALIEAMAHGNCVIANGTPENIEVLSDAGRFYTKNDFIALSALLEDLLDDTSLREELSKKAKQRASRVYNWEQITSQYEELFRELLGRAAKGKKDSADLADFERVA